MLGVLKAGPAVVTLDSGYARIDAITKRAKLFRVLGDIADIPALLQSSQTATRLKIHPDNTALVGGRCVASGYAGRAGIPVRVRGFRVEREDIEMASMGLRGSMTRAVAVVARRRDTIDSILVAHLVGDGGGTDITATREQLRQVLLAYLDPDSFVWLAESPLTPSGKRDDKALRETPLPDDAPRTKGTVRCNVTERAVADIMGNYSTTDRRRGAITLSSCWGPRWWAVRTGTREIGRAHV